MKFTNSSAWLQAIHTILAWTYQSVNLHIALKNMFYLLNIDKLYNNLFNESVFLLFSTEEMAY